MSMLLTKRLARSLWRTKLRLSAVVFMVAVGVFAGISFGAYANAATTLYDEIYDAEEGINLADVWIENPSGIWDEPTSENICNSIANDWPESDFKLQNCESRLILDGMMFTSDSDGTEKAIPAVWHGIDEGLVDKVWMPTYSDLSSGKIAENSDEIVLDSHVATALNIELGTDIEISSGYGKATYKVVGIGFHSMHLYFATEGSSLPAEEGTFATGYMTDAGLEALANLSAGSSNMILIDVEGEPAYDLQSTTKTNENPELTKLVNDISILMNEVDDSPVSVYDRSGVFSVEVLRADAEGAAKMYPYVTGMIAAIAGITIFLSLQRLIQSQAKEIAVLRTLGVSKMAIMPGYIIAPVFIGLFGSVIGTLLGIFVGAPGMLSFFEKMIGLPIKNDVEFSLVFQIVIIAMIVVLLAGIRPAWQASRLQPLKVFRGQHEVKVSSRKLQRITSGLPATVGLSIRSSLRKPMRVGFTFFAVGISMLLFGAMLFMMDSMEDSLLGSIKDKQSWDIQASAPIGGEDAVIDWVEENEGNYELMINFPIGLVDDNRAMLGYGLDGFSTIDDKSSMISVELLSGELPSSNNDKPQVLIDQGTSEFLDWKTGDVVSIMVGNSIHDVEITGITKGEVSRTIYFHRADLSEITGVESTSILIQIPDDSSLEGLSNITVGYSLNSDSIKTVESLLEEQQKALGAVQFLGIIIAIAVLFNTLLMNLAERDTELATLRVLGAPMSKVGKMMFWEHLGIGLIGGILGAIFAYFGTVLLIQSQVQWAFYFTIEPQFAATFTIVGIIVGISIALTPIGMWRIRKMDLVEKVKDLSQ
jgi:putative ABC transport system permease protein